MTKGSDYSSVATPVTFEPCETRKCVAVSITDDMTVEVAEESFYVTLERDSLLNPLITLEPDLAVVTINDRDGMYYIHKVVCCEHTVLY